MVAKMKKVFVILLLLFLIPVTMIVAQSIPIWPIECTVNVQPGEGIAVFRDINLRVPMTTANFGTPQRGEVSLINQYIVNTTNETVTIDIEPKEIELLGKLRLYPETPFELLAGRHTSGWIELQVYPDADLGIKNFTVNITSDYGE
jgi:hypothetical protein